MRAASCVFTLLVAFTLGIGSTSTVQAGKKVEKKVEPAPAAGGTVFEVYKDNAHTVAQSTRKQRVP